MNLLFDNLHTLIESDEGLVFYILGIIAVMEIVDFATGTFAAIINPNIEYKSKVGINGIMRKIVGLFLLMILIPMSILLPDQAGVAFLYTIYIGYMIMIFKSLLENYGKMKGDTSIFENVTAAFEKLIGKHK
ncbi:TPA: phage holin family protein [Streptococcus suis]|uniref:phage holin family protein n=1 Tax=Streptococcus suis TaxID=1307 RepID=UPI000C1982B3|nr:phage holin family protein [Streptococcus suis]HEM5082129.1 phage holin family protein [Streptococcus suis]HEM5208052.1 phage holin family protein [Streptococcus suis]HEM5235369.1 phage holin family protein [Streptococcus suis]HEM5241434.1 phage holin family protein [Streptococcus suis]